MGFDDLSDNDRKLYEYIKAGDFQSRNWSTPEAAQKLGMTETDIYESLTNLAKQIKDNIWIYYENGGMHVVAE
jgi:hypothetical protein